MRASVRTPGLFPSSVERAFNELALFTIDSNLMVSATTLLLAARLDRTSIVFRTLRLTGLIAIIITGIIYHVVLAPTLELVDVENPGNLLVHTIVPLLAVVGWLVFGPRGQTCRRVACLSVILPCCWLAFTLLRGAVIQWYPYRFVDVNALGYAKVILNCFWVSLLTCGLTLSAFVLDSCLLRWPMSSRSQIGPEFEALDRAGRPEDLDSS